MNNNLMKSKKQLKEYCVHITQQVEKLEGIMARTPAEAEEKALGQYSYEEVACVEVMRTCICGLDNDTKNAKCDDCGKAL
jgi:hypothetical protein